MKVPEGYRVLNFGEIIESGDLYLSSLISGGIPDNSCCPVVENGVIWIRRN